MPFAVSFWVRKRKKVPLLLLHIMAVISNQHKALKKDSQVSQNDHMLVYDKVW